MGNRRGEVERAKGIVSGFEKLLKANQRSVKVLTKTIRRLHQFRKDIRGRLLASKEMLNTVLAASERRRYYQELAIKKKWAENPNLVQTMEIEELPSASGLGESQLSNLIASEPESDTQITEAMQEAPGPSPTLYGIPAQGSLQLSSDSSDSYNNNSGSSSSSSSTDESDSSDCECDGDDEEKPDDDDELGLSLSSDNDSQIANQ